jgi:hypothetical protein
MTSIPLAPLGGTAKRDNGIRPLEGVVVSLRNVDAETVCLAFDDVVSSATTLSKPWNFKTFYTHADFPAEAVHEMSLSDEQYRDIGIALMVRLVAIHELSYKKKGGAGVA